MLFLFQIYDTDLFRFRIGDRNYLFDDLVPRVYNPLHLLDLNAVVVKLISMTKQVLACCFPAVDRINTLDITLRKQQGRRRLRRRQLAGIHR